MTERIPIASIIIEERRRQTVTGIEGLARNINEHGLIHPIIVTADNILIAGERRLRAHQHLKLDTIEVRRWHALTVEERCEIELAENLNRQDLTAAERSRQMVALAEVAADLLPNVGNKSNGRGRPQKADSEAKVSKRIGVPQQTLNRAKQHVAAIDAHPELTPYPQTDALKMAARLDAMPESERAETLALMREQAADRGAAPKRRKRKEAPRLGLKPGNGAHDWQQLERERLKSEALLAASNACTAIDEARVHVMALIATRKEVYGEPRDETTSDDCREWQRAIGLAEEIINAIRVGCPAIGAGERLGVDRDPVPGG